MSQFRRLLAPRWVLAHLVVLLIVVGFVRLGFWQLDRLESRRIENAVGEARFAQEPVELSLLLEGAAGDFESLENRRALVTGAFFAQDEVLIRSQVYRATAGFHVITPLVLDGGGAVLINRGWVPLGLDVVPVSKASPPPGEVTVVGWVHLPQEKPAFGPPDSDDGRLTALNRVDIARIQEQTEMTLAPVYLVALGEGTGSPPVPVKPPVFDDEGPHLAYAIQWFGFTLIGLVGYAFLLRKQFPPSV